MNARSDVIVVGAGPAGSAAAATLAGAGMRTLLVDRSAFPREKVCGDGLLPDAVAALERLGLTGRVRSLGNEIVTARFVAASGREMQLPLAGLVTRRLALDGVLFDEAVRRGAEPLGESTLRDVELEDGQGVVAVLERDGHLERRTADVLLLATGAAPTVRRLAGLGAAREPLAAALRGYAALPRGDSSELRIDLRADLLGGYAWAFPVGGGLWNVGCGVGSGIRDAPALGRVLARYGSDLGAVSWEGRTRGAALFTRFPHCRVSRGRVAAIGEAAGLTRPFSGEGIGPALESGVMAALAVAESPGPRGVRVFERRLRRRYAADFRAWRFGELFLRTPRLVDLMVSRARRYPGAVRRLAGVLSGTVPASSVLSPVGLLRLIIAR